MREFCASSFLGWQEIMIIMGIMTATVVAGFGVPGQLCTGGHILGGAIFLRGGLSLEELCHQGGDTSGAVTILDSHISGAVTSLDQ